MQELLKEKISGALGLTAEQVIITVPEQDSFGHYSTNVAMRFAKERGKDALELAHDFAHDVQNADGVGMFMKIEVVKPGFINFWLSEKFLTEHFVSSAGGGKVLGDSRGTVVIDYSACNIAKPMHVGHLRSTVIGDALANIHEYLGYKAVRWNYLGDWGTQFGKLIVAYKKWGSKEEIEKDPIGSLLELYVRVSTEAKANPALDDEARAEFKKLEDVDKENRKLWEWFKDESLTVFHKLFKRLGVKFDLEIGESFYEEAVYDVLKELKEKNLLIPSEGGQIVNLDQFNLPVMLIQKSDGASLYVTRDIASMKHRLSRYKPVKLLYVVANQQALHFEQLFAVAKLMGLTSAEMTHVKFGMVLGEDGKKLATREGKVISLESLLNEVVGKALSVVQKNNAEMPESEQREIAEIVGIGALKYGDLKENRNSDIVFDWDRMLDLHGDSAPYLQYTVVRLQSILKKAGAPSVNAATLDAVDDQMKSILMKKVLDFDDVVDFCAQTYYTSHLAKYLFELAKLTNQYYESVRILDDTSADSAQVKIARRDGRLMLVGKIAATITQGLKLLGIEVPARL